MNTTIHTHIEHLSNQLIKRSDLQPNTDWVKQALFNVPRHYFIEQYYDDGAPDGIVQVGSPTPTPEQLEQIYSDRGMMIREEPHSAASQPNLIFGMLRDLQLTHGHKVLEVGTGSGWNAGLIAFTVGDDSLVHSIDLQADLVEKARHHLNSVGFNRVNLKAGDGGLGWDGETFDRIIVTVGSADIPPAWIQSLTDDGILVMPLKTKGVGDPILQLHKQGNKLTGKFTQGAGFMNLQGNFKSDSENALEPSSDPVVEALLQEEPTTVPFSTVFGTDCAFWLRLNGVPMQTLWEYKGQRGMYPVLLDKELPALYVPQSVYSTKTGKRMDVYGNPQLVDRFIEGIEEWVSVGSPKLTDYHIELINSAELNDTTLYHYIDQRPNATLRFSLKDASTSRD
ncbi:MAG: methyltransferase domain-containing protein [Candidatus Poribacteria bacterium]|nr:methyltransferase domain-containing protein [Candidatus Poribacteria bacterium]